MVQSTPEWDSTKIIGDVEDSFDKYSSRCNHFPDIDGVCTYWRAYYNGWVEGRIKMLGEIEKENTYPERLATVERRLKILYEKLSNLDCKYKSYNIALNGILVREINLTSRLVEIEKKIENEDES